MKKQNSLYRMTTSEMQIMTYLWNSKEPAIASQIVSDLIPTQNCTWKPRSVFTILKSLSEKDLIHDVGYVRTGKTYSRKFAPKVSRAEYLAMQVMNELPDQELPEFLLSFQRSHIP